jgi:peptidoglycan-associated lipoprotein
MVKTRGTTFVVAFILTSLLTIASCEKAVIRSDPSMTGTSADEKSKEAEQAAEEAKKREIDETNLRQARLREEAAKRTEAERAERDRFVNENIYFDFNESILRPEAREILKRKAQWLRRHPNASIIIEGHCDERGTGEYNIALGEKRAERAKTFLVNLGIERSRMTTISYGEERPAVRGHDEASWAKNRRARFVIE